MGKIIPLTLIRRGFQGDLACSQGQRWSPSACMGGKEGTKGGRHTRWFHSGDPVSTAYIKKRRERKEKTSTSPSKARGGKKRTNSVFPWMSLLFALPFSHFISPFCFTYIPTLSQSLFFFSLPPIIASPSVSVRRVFQGLPSIDTVSTNSSPPASSWEPLWEGAELWGGPPGKAYWVCGDTVELERSRKIEEMEEETQ